MIRGRTSAKRFSPERSFKPYRDTSDLRQRGNRDGCPMEGMRDQLAGSTSSPTEVTPGRMQGGPLQGSSSVTFPARRTRAQQHEIGGGKLPSRSLPPRKRHLTDSSVSTNRLMADRDSSLMSCSILQASSAAVSRLTPSLVRKAVRMVWRS